MSLDFKSVYNLLQAQHGEQDWWPGDNAFEIIIGAILTQNTAWTNVEKALANLKQANALSLPGILDVDQDSLAELIRPSGYYNQKAKRLQGFCAWLDEQGGIEALQQRDTLELRKEPGNRGRYLAVCARTTGVCNRRIHPPPVFTPRPDCRTGKIR